MHLSKHIFFLFLLLNFLLFAQDNNVTPDLRAEFALHSMSKLKEADVLLRDLRSEELDSDIHGFSNLYGVTYSLIFFAEVCSVHKNQSGVLWPGELSVIDKTPSLLEYLACLEVLALTETLTHKLRLVFFLYCDFLN